MKDKLRIWHLLFLFWIVLIIFRFEFIIDSFLLLINFMVLLITDFNMAIQSLDFSFIDVMISIVLFISIPVILFFKRKRTKWFYTSMNFSTLILSLLVFAFIFAPLITNENPDFQKDLKVTKLLPPFASVKVIHLKNNNNLPSGSFTQLKSKVIKPSFDESVIFANSVKIKSDKIVYYQKIAKKELSKSALLQKNGKPQISNRLYLFGTDEFGRDIFTRLIYGARISLLIGTGSVLVSLLIGLTLGFFAGFKSGWIDVVLSRFTDLFLAFPVIYLIVLILALFGNTLLSVIVVLGISGWMSLFKIVKSEVVAARQKDYLITAEMLGLNKSKILFNEILPVIFVPVLVNIIFQFSNVILAESALSYLGLGSGSSYPSWGAMIESGQQYIYKAWWLIIFPGLTLIFTLFSANDIGNKLKNKLNPRIET